MRIKTSELTGHALDWAVGTCEGHDKWRLSGKEFGPHHTFTDLNLNYSTDWTQGGPIIARMGDYLQEGNKETGEYYCSTPSVAEEWHNHPVRGIGPTPLIAAMRCYVASQLGDEVEIPESLA